jgi:hypothetical protein
MSSDLEHRQGVVLVSGAKWNPLHKPLQPIADDLFSRFGAQMAWFS